MTHQVRVAGSARRYVRRLPRQLSNRVIERLDTLANDPYDSTISKPLHGQLSGLRSSDLDWLRILYGIEDKNEVVPVVDVDPRGDIYKR